MNFSPLAWEDLKQTKEEALKTYNRDRAAAWQDYLDSKEEAKNARIAMKEACDPYEEIRETHEALRAAYRDSQNQ